MSKYSKIKALTINKRYKLHGILLPLSTIFLDHLHIRSIPIIIPIHRSIFDICIQNILCSALDINF